MKNIKWNNLRYSLEWTTGQIKKRMRKNKRLQIALYNRPESHEMNKNLKDLYKAINTGHHKFNIFVASSGGNAKEAIQHLEDFKKAEHEFYKKQVEENKKRKQQGLAPKPIRKLDITATINHAESAGLDLITGLVRGKGKRIKILDTGITLYHKERYGVKTPMGELTNIVGNTHFLHNKPYPIKNSGRLGNQLMNLDKNKRILNFRNNHTIKSSPHDEIIKLLKAHITNPKEIENTKNFIISDNNLTNEEKKKYLNIVKRALDPKFINRYQMFKGSDKDYLQNARDSVKKGLADEVINTIDHDHPYKLKILNPHHHSYYNPRNMSGKIENNLLNIAQHQQIKAKVKNIIKSGKTDNIEWNDDDIHKKYHRFRLYKNLLDNNKSNKSFKSITEKWKDKINLNTNRD